MYRVESLKLFGDMNRNKYYIDINYFNKNCE